MPVSRFNCKNLDLDLFSQRGSPKLRSPSGSLLGDRFGKRTHCDSIMLGTARMTLDSPKSRVTSGSPIPQVAPAIAMRGDRCLQDSARIPKAATPPWLNSCCSIVVTTIDPPC